MQLEEQIIQFVKRNEFIYNKEHPDYRNLILRHRQFIKLSSELNVPVKVLKKKWRTLRDNFRREIKKMELEPENARRKWKWMDQLMFIKPGDIRNRRFASDGYDDSSNSVSSQFESHFSAKQEVLSEYGEDGNEIQNDTVTNANDVLMEGQHEEVIISTRTNKNSANPPTKTAAQLFFQSLAKMTDDADLTSEQFVGLQIEILRTFKNVIYEDE